MDKKLLKSYIIGFILSIFLTACAFIVTAIHVYSAHETISHEVLIPAIITFALVQMLVQLAFFLHLVYEKNPRWNTIFFFGTLSVIFIVVVGSIWIMNHLNYNMTPAQMEQYTQSQDGF